MNAYLYILRRADGSYCVGTTRDSLEKRLAEHQAGTFDGYMAHRREDAVSAERQIKGWRREKKETLIRGDYAALPSLARRGSVPLPVRLSRYALKAVPQK